VNLIETGEPGVVVRVDRYLVGDVYQVRAGDRVIELPRNALAAVSKGQPRLGPR
jgi:hypothetical protein